MKPVLSILLHGPSGGGKSWCGGTAPRPVLVLDAEGRARYLPGKKIEWDPLREDPPKAGDWEICIVNLTKYDQFTRVYQWLQSGQHCFRSVDIDSVMEAQKRLIDSLVGNNQLQIQDWGSVLRNLESMIRSYRDLALLDSNSIECVVFICGSQVSDNGVHEPLLQGALRKMLPYLVDAVGYLYVTHEDNGQLTRNLLVEPRQTIVAKDGTNRLGGPIIQNPNLSTMFEELERQE